MVLNAWEELIMQNRKLAILVMVLALLLMSIGCSKEKNHVAKKDISVNFPKVTGIYVPPKCGTVPPASCEWNVNISDCASIEGGVSLEIVRKCMLVHETTWENLLSMWVENAFVNLDDFVEGYEETASLACIISTGFGPFEYYTSLFSEDFFNGPLLKILSTEELRETAYNWAIPKIKKKIKSLPKKDQASYLYGLKQWKGYLEKYDHEKERAYKTDLILDSCPWYKHNPSRGETCLNAFSGFSHGNTQNRERFRFVIPVSYRWVERGLTTDIQLKLLNKLISDLD
jgi:hypothetical protein